jgi:flagellar secretion chaperone FliS
MITYECNASACNAMSTSPNTINLVVMSYDRLIEDLKNVVRFRSSSMNDRALTANKHAQDIITELLLGLDYKQGGEIAGNLSRLYSFALRNLLDYSHDKDINIYTDLINIFDSLKEAWSEISIKN